MGVQSSGLQNTKISSILLLLRQTGCVCANQLFSVFKKCGNYTYYVLRAVWCLANGGFVHQIKMCQQIRRKVSIRAA